MAHDTDVQADPHPSADPEPASPLGQNTQGACCGGAASKDADACCALDADVKSAGGSGYGCSPQPAAAKKKTVEPPLSEPAGQHRSHASQTGFVQEASSR